MLHVDADHTGCGWWAMQMSVCQDRFSRLEADVDGGAKAMGECVGSGDYYLRVVRVEAK